MYFSLKTINQGFSEYMFVSLMRNRCTYIIFLKRVKVDTLKAAIGLEKRYRHTSPLKKAIEESQSGLGSSKRIIECHKHFLF